MLVIMILLMVPFSSQFYTYSVQLLQRYIYVYTHRLYLYEPLHPGSSVFDVHASPMSSKNGDYIQSSLSSGRGPLLQNRK